MEKVLNINFETDEASLSASGVPTHLSRLVL
jgi:hypothetical protein